MVSSPSRWRVAILAVLTAAISATLSFHHLGANSLFGDEALFATVAHGVVADQQWYPIYSANARYVSKPPLSIWPMALRFELAGESELNARIGNAVGGVIVSLLLFALGTWLIDAYAGTIAALLLITAHPWLLDHGVREGVGDIWTALFTGVALVAYVRSRLPVAVMAAAAGSLIKGPVVFLVLFGVGLLWEVAAKFLLGRRPRWLAPFAVVLISAIPFALWVVDSARDPVIRARLWAQFIGRHTQAIDPTHLHDALFYPLVLGGAFGWWLIALLIPPLWRFLRTSETALLLPLWAFFPIVTFSLSVSKLPWYLDPALPPLAMLIGLAVYLGIARIGSQPWRYVLGALVVGTLSWRVFVAWKAVHAPPQQTDMHRLVLAYRTAAHPTLYVDELKEPSFEYREWNYYYLDLLEQHPIPATIDRSRCSVVVTMHPDPLLRRTDFAGAEMWQMHKYDPREADLYVIDLCGGRFTRALAAGH